MAVWSARNVHVYLTEWPWSKLGMNFTTFCDAKNSSEIKQASGTPMQGLVLCVWHCAWMSFQGQQELALATDLLRAGNPTHVWHHHSTGQFWCWNLLFCVRLLCQICYLTDILASTCWPLPARPRFEVHQSGRQGGIQQLLPPDK